MGVATQEVFATAGSADEGKAAIIKMFLRSFMHENALNPIIFPSLMQFEVEIVAMTAWMLNGPEGTVGSVTSGGTESILMAVKTYRDRARNLFPQIKSPEMVIKYVAIGAYVLNSR